MRLKCFYEDRNGERHPISIWELNRLKNRDHKEFLYRKIKLYKHFKGTKRMDAVLKKGYFRNHVDGGNITNLSRGDNESLTHAFKVEVISELDVIPIKMNGKIVKLYPKKINFDNVSIYCNGRRYEPDLQIELEKTDPEEYYDIFNGFIAIEVFHTCPVDSKQAEDFAVEGISLYEYKIINFELNDNISEEAYNKLKIQDKEYLNKNGIPGYIICTHNGNTLLNWKKNEKGNYVSKIDDIRFTIFEQNNEIWIAFDNTYKNEFNGKRFADIDAAKKVANYLAFMRLNAE